jgi:hypothetical protein
MLAEEPLMQGISVAKYKYILRAVSVLIAFLALIRPAYSQSSPAPRDQKMDLQAVSALLQQMQEQIQQLQTQVTNLRAEQQSERAASDKLRNELTAARSQMEALKTPAQPRGAQAIDEQPSAGATAEERVNKLEETQQLADAKIRDLSQTRVESGSKYRVRFSGIALFNMFDNRGSVDNADFPQLAVPAGLASGNSSVGGSVRQSQIEVQAFGPTIGGARTSADVYFDFAGGFPDAANGASFGIMRLRTGVIRFDWRETSLVAGQDTLFFAPLSPTSLATLATPALAYSGNLWSWTPQIRLEHKFVLSDSKTVVVQGGILDSLSGDKPPSTFDRYASWGERSGQPSYAVRLAWNQAVGSQTLTLGASGYYGRQAWGFVRSVDSWAGMLDAKVPLSNKFEFTSQFYRGRGIGGLGGGIGQTAVWSGSFADPATQIYGLDSIGGWAQLKFAATSKLQFNGAFGLDNPFATQLRTFGATSAGYPFPLAKNESGLLNFIYQPRSDIVFSMEYRRLKTFTLDSRVNAANIASLSLGYLF